MAQLALAGRLLAPALAMAALTGTVLNSDPQSLWWQPGLGPAFPLSVCTDAFAGLGSAPAAAEPADGLGALLTGPVAALVHACRSYSLSPQVLWGNVSSALNGAAVQLAAAEPGAAPRTWLITARLLDQRPLRGSSQAGPGPDFARLSCCLIYRLARSPAESASAESAPVVSPPVESASAVPVCGDCILGHRLSPRRSGELLRQHPGRN
jgi:hypothetical protein